MSCGLLGAGGDIRFTYSLAFTSNGTSAVKFGQKTVHPMYMWLANIVGTDKQKKDKKFRLYKCSVYHKVISIVLKGIRRYEHLGFKVQVGHCFNKLIFPRIFMLQADMAELYTLLLLLGIGSEFRCAICLAPEAELHNLSHQFLTQSETETKSGTVAAAKELTSRSSIRPEKSAKSGLTNLESFTCMEIQDAMKAHNLSTVLVWISRCTHVQDEDRFLVLRQEKLTAVERALTTLSEHFGMSTKFSKGHLPQHFVDLIAEGGTLDHQMTAHGEQSHRPVKEHIIAQMAQHPSAPTRIQDFTLFRSPFTSFVDQRIYEDYLRFHPNWQKAPRYNNAILQNKDGTISFAQIFRLFSCCVEGKEFQIIVFREYTWMVTISRAN
ncbi:hypothetical protein BT69DRAFT_1291909 [Atractiella rhizophila]|nr:hypothetical protein BT69DRAFT_1291909 [Atractiella rhizophila]